MQNNIYYKTYSSGFFKIVRETKCYYFMKSLKMDRELKVDTSVLFFSFGENDHYKHYADEIDERSEEIKIMKKKFNYTIFNNGPVWNTYFKNNELKFDFLTSLFSTNKEKLILSQKIYNNVLGFSDQLKNYIARETDGQYKILHDQRLALLKADWKIYTDLYTTEDALENDLLKKVIERLKLLVDVVEIQYQLTPDLSEHCSVCLDEDETVYKGFFKCSHCICKNCHKGLHKKICPLCRSI